MKQLGFKSLSQHLTRGGERAGIWTASLYSISLNTKNSLGIIWNTESHVCSPLLGLLELNGGYSGLWSYKDFSFWEYCKFCKNCPELQASQLILPKYDKAQELNKLSVMDPDLGADTDLGHETGLEACGGATEEQRGDTERQGEEEGLLNIKGGDGEFSSASSSSNSSLPPSSTVPPVFSLSSPVCVEEEKEMLSGCSKSFTGLKLFTRR